MTEPTMTKLSGKTALVTGAGSGIGRACALRLAAAGAHVLAVDVNGEAAEKVAGEVGGMPIIVDLSDPEFLYGVRGQLPNGFEQHDGIRITADILVNNAGFQHVSPLEDFPPEIFDKMIKVMVEAPFQLVRATLPHMYENNWGRVINISSVHGLRASPFKAAYVTAKHALEGLSKVIALEGAAHGVTSNCVCPAYVRTPLVESQIADQARTHGIPEEQVVEQIMLQPAAIKRLIEPDEVAEIVSYLCGPHGSFITGVSIPLDGGWTAH
jgi:3-hydroxybutyrate dehydrogenase